MSVGKSFNSFLLPLNFLRSDTLSIALSAMLCECAAIPKFQNSKTFHGGISHNEPMVYDVGFCLHRKLN